MSMVFTRAVVGPITRIDCTWTSAADGTASGTTPYKVVGELVKAITNPGAAAPTANYDIAITDDNSLDVLTGVQSTLANRHTSDTEVVYFFVLDAAATPLAQSVHPVVADALTVSVTAAGDSKNGVISLFVRTGYPVKV